MKYNIFSTLNPILGRFFHGSGFFRIGSGFLADPDPDSEKRLIRIREKKPGSETLINDAVNVLAHPGAASPTPEAPTRP